MSFVVMSLSIRRIEALLILKAFIYWTKVMHMVLEKSAEA